MTEKTLGQIARDSHETFKNMCPTDAQIMDNFIPNSWKAIAQVVVDTHEARKWRDIESAPTDTYILCLEPDGVMSVMYLCSIYGRWTLSSDNRSSPMYEPTLWQPLPAPTKQGD